MTFRYEIKLSITKERQIKSGAVFVTKNGNPLDRSNIWSNMKKLCEAANVSEKKVFPHNLRHLFTRTYYALQKDIVRLADILGHSSVNTTRIYTMESGEVHIYPYLGDYPISKITTVQIQRMYNDLRENGRKSCVEKYGKGLTGNTVRGIHMLLHEINTNFFIRNLLLQFAFFLWKITKFIDKQRDVWYNTG